MSNILRKDRAVVIADNFIEVFSAFARSPICIYRLSYPIFEHSKRYCKKICECDENKEIYNTTYIRILEWHDDENSKITETYEQVEWPNSSDCINVPSKVFEHNTYFIFYKNKEYKMKIYNSPECCGWNSTIDDEEYDEETYLLCEIEEYEDEKIKYEMSFGFDVESMSFLELFDITYINKKRFRRECKDIEEIEAELFGRKLK